MTEESYNPTKGVSVSFETLKGLGKKKKIETDSPFVKNCKMDAFKPKRLKSGVFSGVFK